MVRQVFAVGCLFTACAVLVESSGRAPASHLFFAVVVCVVTLYQDAITYVGALVFLALYHLGLGMLSPAFIYPETMREDIAVSWSLTFFLVAVFTSLVGVLAWVLNSRSMQESQALKVALAEAGLRERQARDLNDSVVQHLVTVVYASEVGDTTTAMTAARDGLAAARQLVASLLAPTWLRDHILLRDDPSQVEHADASKEYTPTDYQDGGTR
jgi:signal transduction histidine kinase